MDWTVEQDEQLKALHAKRVGPLFIASWMRWPPSAVRARLIELGLTKPLTPRATAITEAAKARRSVVAQPSATLCDVESLDDAVDDEQELKTRPGCPRGHLLSESQIAALYRAASCNY
jgi:hypothetical protein